MLWRAGLRISEALALNETDLDPDCGAVLIRRCCARHFNRQITIAPDNGNRPGGDPTSDQAHTGSARSPERSYGVSRLDRKTIARDVL